MVRVRPFHEWNAQFNVPAAMAFVELLACRGKDRELIVSAIWDDSQESSKSVNLSGNEVREAAASRTDELRLLAGCRGRPAACGLRPSALPHLEKRRCAPKWHMHLAVPAPRDCLCGKRVVALHPLRAVQRRLICPPKPPLIRRIARTGFGTRVRFAASSPVRCSPAAALRCGFRACPCTKSGPCKSCAEAAPKSR
jgi:hypothetical protein